jgi:hypothetical protein
MPRDLSVTVIHRLRGRLRLRLSQAPSNPGNFSRTIKGHEGIELVEYNRHSRSVLIRHDPELVSQEEIIMRTALSLSRDNEFEPVTLFDDPVSTELSPPEYYSAVSLLMATAYRFLSKKGGRRGALEIVSGLGTGYAVLTHGLRDIRREGKLHPEVLSVVYLAIAFVRGNMLPAALFTWASSFGRHLVRLPRTGVRLVPVKQRGTRKRGPQEITIYSEKVESEWESALKVLPALFSYALTGSRSFVQEGGFMKQIREISSLHNQVIEGLGGTKQGFKLEFGNKQ